METIKGFVARDKDGQLCIFYGDKPHRGGCNRWWHPEHCPLGDWMNIPSGMFPELKWEDEPMEIELIIKKSMKAFTDIEQGRKLAEILSSDSADMYYKYVLPKSDKINHVPEIGNPVDSLKWYNEGYTFKGKREPITLNEYCIPCWSLAALLEIIKKLVGYSLQSLDTHTVFMNCELGDKPYNIETENYDNSIDAAFEMIIHLHERNIL